MKFFELKRVKFFYWQCFFCTRLPPPTGAHQPPRHLFLFPLLLDPLEHVPDQQLVHRRQEVLDKVVEEHFRDLSLTPFGNFHPLWAIQIMRDTLGGRGLKMCHTIIPFFKHCFRCFESEMPCSTEKLGSRRYLLFSLFISHLETYKYKKQ